VRFQVAPAKPPRYRQPVTGNPLLIKEISRELAAAGGRLTFDRFMDLALYHPQHGYYTAGRERIGRAGDYYTSVSVGPLFGRLLAGQFRQWRAELGNPGDFTVVEVGSHHGQLRADVLAAAPELDYRAIEVGDPLPDQITGVVFSNELLDALPVHRVKVDGGQWKEVYVRLGQASPPHPAPHTTRGRPLPQGARPAPVYSPLPSGGEGQGEGAISFTEVCGPLSDPRLADALRGLPVQLMEGYTTEVGLRARDWLTGIARRLIRGYVLTIDYGCEHDEYFAPHRRDGTLQCYHQHTRNNDPYARVGEQDITAHVQFTSLMQLGETLGLETVRFTDQAHYLLEIGEAEITEIVARTAGQPSQERRAIHQLIHPELMGRSFRVLVQRRAGL